jgi:peptidoglycan lytic transglycosylase
VGCRGAPPQRGDRSVRVAARLAAAAGLCGVLASPDAHRLPIPIPARFDSCAPPLQPSVDSLMAAGRWWHAWRAVGATPARRVRPESVLVRALIAEGMHDAAGVEELLARARGTDAVPDLLAVAARADERAGRWQAAESRYRRLLARTDTPDDLRNWATVRLPVTLENEGLDDSAAAAWRRAAVAIPELADWFGLRRAVHEPDTTVAFVTAGGARSPGARARADALIASRRMIARNLPGAAEAYRRAGRTMELLRVRYALGERRETRAIADSTLLADPSRPTAFQAATFLTENFDSLTMDEALGVAQAYRARNDRLTAERYARRAIQGARGAVEPWLELGEILADRRDLLGALRAVDSAGARAGRVRGALIAAARVRVLLACDRIEDADRLLAAVVRAYRNDSTIARVMLERADRHRARGEGAAEQDLYRTLLQRYPDAPATIVGRFRYGLQMYAAGEHESAWVHVALAVRADTAGVLGLGPRYWRLRLALETGDSGAGQQLRLLARQFPFEFYGVRAREILGDTDFLVDTVLDAPRPGSFAPARARERVRMLAALGLDAEARAEATGWARDSAVSVRVLLAAAQAAAEAGYARESILLGEAARARAGVLRGVAQALYPLPYRAVIVGEADEYCVDPLLFAALIRQESRFEPRAVSPAGAYGMSQVMPATGQFMAAQLHLGPWNREMLFVPDFNLHLGARYLYEREVRDSLPPLPLLASYNAGTGRVARWRRWPEFGDPDLFAERVTIVETRDYLKTVYASYVWYRYAWSSAPAPGSAPPPLP